MLRRATLEDELWAQSLPQEDKDRLMRLLALAISRVNTTNGYHLVEALRHLFK